MLNNGEQQNEKERFVEKQKGLNMSTSFAGSRDEYKTSFVMEERRMCTSHIVVQGDAGVYFEVYRDYKEKREQIQGEALLREQVSKSIFPDAEAMGNLIHNWAIGR